MHRIGLFTMDDKCIRIVIENLKNVLPVIIHNLKTVSTFENINALQFTKDQYACIIIDLDLENAKEFAREVSKMNDHAEIILISEDLHDSYKTNDIDASAFIYKGNTVGYLYEALCSLKSRLSEVEGDYLKIRWKNAIYMVAINEVVYIERDRRKTFVHTMNNEVYSTYMKMNEVIGTLPNYFLRVHFSYVVNLNFVKEFYRDHVSLYKGQFIPISRTYANNVKDYLHPDNE